MTAKEIKLQVQKLKAKAEAIVKESEERKQIAQLPFHKRVMHFLDTVFTCADKNEIWLPYPHNPDYMVSSEGNVKSIKFGKEIELIQNTANEYTTVGIWSHNERKTVKVHKMVAETFLYKSEDNLQVNHKDEDKRNNCLDNLEYVTARENKTMSRRGISQYAGVTYVNRNRKWKAQVHWEGTTKCIGTFETEIEAAEAYQQFLKDNNITNRYATV